VGASGHPISATPVKAPLACSPARAFITPWRDCCSPIARRTCR
jgi:hypothetical protein